MSDYVKKIHPRTRSMNLKLSPFLKEKPIVYTNSKFLSIPPCVRIFGPGVVHSQKPPYYQRKKKSTTFPVSENHPHLQLRPSTGDAQKMPGVLGIPVMKNTRISRRFTPNLTIFSMWKNYPGKKKKHPNQPWQWLENFQQIQWWLEGGTVVVSSGCYTTRSTIFTWPRCVHFNCSTQRFQK